MVVRSSSFPPATNNYGGDSLGLLGEAIPGTIKIEHVFTLKFSDKWERPLRKWVDKCLDLSKHYAESFQFIAAGIGSYFFFLGVSKVVQARNRPGSNDDNSYNNTKKKKLKTKEKTKNSNADTVVAGDPSPRPMAEETSVTGQLQSSSAKPDTVESTPVHSELAQRDS